MIKKGKGEKRKLNNNNNNYKKMNKISDSFTAGLIGYHHIICWDEIQFTIYVYNAENQFEIKYLLMHRADTKSRYVCVGGNEKILLIV